MNGDTAPITFVVPGQEIAPSTRSAAVGEVRGAVRLAARRGAGEQVSLVAQPGRDVVVLQIDNGPRLVLHPESARDLMAAQSPAAVGRGAAAQSHIVQVSAQLGWPGLETAAPARGTTRGWLGKVVLKTIEVVAAPTKDEPAKLAAKALADHVDGQVVAGVYALRPDALPRLKGSARMDQVPAADGAMLVLIHGTFVDTQSTFGKLWSRHPKNVKALFERYGGRVYALDHPTVGSSPFANAMTLVEALPEGAKLHLVTHSRGGLVAEVLARVCDAGQPLQDDARLAQLFRDDPDARPPRDYTAQRAELKALAALARDKRISVERVVRIACPARGTLLASRRLDAFLSVFAWLLEGAAVPVLPEFVSFLNEVARRRTSPEELPGVEAMLPGSGLVNWLHDVEEPIAGQLRVVAGDLQGDSLASWLKTLLSDAFYWTDNDLVVQTRSMYGGVPRRDEAVFLLDRGSGVDHFSYFANETTADGITKALLQSAPPRGFFTIGPLSWGGASAEGLRAARPRRGPLGDPSTLPAVFVLPGILGTNLKADGRRIWLSWRLINGLAKLKWQGDFKVEPDGPVASSYDDLIDHLGDTHEVIPFGYDWRKPVTDEAARLATEIEKAMSVRSGSGQPVRIVAHSMGGLVARAVQLVRPLTWQRMLAHPQSRVLMLGTPNGGSWAPMQVLSGDDTCGNALTAIGSLFDDAAARAVMAGMPGFLQLQAGLLDPALGLASESKWKQLAEDDLKQVREHNVWHNDDRQLAPYTWGVPPQSVLDEAVRLRRQFDDQVAALQPQSDKLLLVVGKERFTPAGYQLTDAGLEYLDAPNGGDGRVTVDSACLPGVRTWMVDTPHGNLADKATAFDAYVDLLENGTTTALARLQSPRGRGGDEGGATPVAMPRQPTRPSRLRTDAVMPPAQPADVLTAAPSSTPPPADTRSAPPFVVSVINGNLRFVKQPLMLGHYRSMALTGTEAAMDHLLHGTMRESIEASLYPDAIGSHQIFFNQWRDPEYPLQMPRPKAVIVVGLGEEGKLRSPDIAKAARQATIAFAQRVAEAPTGADASFELAATLIASGGTGVTPGISAQMVAQGVMDANERLSRTGWPVVSRLDFIELFLDRAGEAWRGLDIVRTSDPSRFQLEEGVREGTGPLLKPLDSGYRGARYDFVSAVAHRNAQGDTLIEYSLDTRRARAEVRGQSTQSKLIRELVTIAADDRNRNQQIGRTLFHLLVPVELEPFLASSGDIVLELDTETASYPWELMDTQLDDSGAAEARSDPPWAIRSRLLRKLRTDTFRENPVGAGSEGGVLVIGEPVSDSKLYPPLPGARREAEAVASVFAQQQLLINADALAIVNTLLDSRYRIVHVAGHGEYRRSGGGGVVLSNGTVLGPREIKSMRTVPELVFVNCCFLGVIEAEGSQRSSLGRLRPAFAANVAEELIRIGVRCVVAAGWAVDDDPAMLFATHFYEQLQRGARFMDAIASARDITWRTHRQSNTWAAYQCYGDPDWTLQPSPTGVAPASRANEGAQDIISPEGLTLALETIATETRFSDKSPETQLDRVHALASRYGSRWGSRGGVAEAFGRAYGESGDFDAGLDWYERAVAAEDGGASIKAIEQLSNLRVRRAWQRVSSFKEPERRGAEWKQALREARKEMAAAGQRLRMVHELQPTFERANLLGSAYKRLAMLEGLAGDKDAWCKAVEATAEAYRRAGEIGEQRQLMNWYYPELNRMAATLALATATGEARDLDAGVLERMRAAIEQHHDADPNFWSAVQAVELSFYKSIAERQLAQDLPKLLVRYEDVHARVASPKLWQSVLDQATFALGAYKEDAVGEVEARAGQELLDALKRYVSE